MKEKIMKVFVNEVTTPTYTAKYYHGNEMTLDPTTHTLVDKMISTHTNPAPHISTINIKFVKDALAQIEANEVAFPLAITLDEGDYFVTINKDKTTKKAKLDKNGKKHAVIVVSRIAKIEKAPIKEMTFEDAYDLE